LLLRARALCGQRVSALAELLGVAVPTDNRRSKGFVGGLCELALGADVDAGERPDFLCLGIELKTIPCDRHGKPAESTFCCSIAFGNAANETWEESRLRQRLRRVLWVPVESAKVCPTLGERIIGVPRLWSPSAAEFDALRADWEHLMGAIGAGRAATLSAREGDILQVRPKARLSSDRCLSPAADGTQMALPLGFYLRVGFTATIFGF